MDSKLPSRPTNLRLLSWHQVEIQECETRCTWRWCSFLYSSTFTFATFQHSPVIVLFPILFNIHLRIIPTPPPVIEFSSHTDDCTIHCTVTLFKLASNAHSISQEMFINIVHVMTSTSRPVPQNKKPEILGVTFDQMLILNKQVKNKLHSRGTRFWRH